jgi:hypothetical protein
VGRTCCLDTCTGRTPVLPQRGGAGERR